MTHVGPSRILLVEDDEDAREELAEALEAAAYTCRAVATAEAAITAFSEEAFAVVISDLKLPTADGNALIRQLGTIAQREGRNWRAILISGHAEKHDVIAAMRSGVIDYIDKPIETVQLICAIQRAEQQLAAEHTQADARIEHMSATLHQLGQSVQALREHIERGQQRPSESSMEAAHAPLPELTPRMWEVLRHIRAGKSNYVIACDMGISENTVKLYVSQILHATPATNRTQLALYAERWLPRAEAGGLLPKTSADS